MLRSSRGDAVVLLATFLLTIFVDLITGIAVGVVFGALLFLHRMAGSGRGRRRRFFTSTTSPTALTSSRDTMRVWQAIATS